MPRFVVLEHDHPFLHWDLMLEAGNVLRTWRLVEEPTNETATAGIPAEPLPDHRVAYLDYEGPVSGDRGHVVRRDQGEWRPCEESPGRVEMALSGQTLTGRFVIAPMAPAEGATSDREATDRSGGDGSGWRFYRVGALDT